MAKTTFLESTAGKRWGIRQHQGVAPRYQKTRRGRYAGVRRNKRNLSQQIRSVSSGTTPRISWKKERMCQSWQLDIKAESPPQMFFSFYLKGHKMFLLLEWKGKLAEARSTIGESTRTHTVNLNLISTWSLSMRLDIDSSSKLTTTRFLCRWLGIYASYYYFLFLCADRQAFWNELMVCKSALNIFNTRIHIFVSVLIFVCEPQAFKHRRASVNSESDGGFQAQRVDPGAFQMFKSHSFSRGKIYSGQSRAERRSVTSNEELPPSCTCVGAEELPLQDVTTPQLCGGKDAPAGGNTSIPITSLTAGEWLSDWLTE